MGSFEDHIQRIADMEKLKAERNLSRRGPWRTPWESIADEYYAKTGKWPCINLMRRTVENEAEKARRHRTAVRLWTLRQQKRLWILNAFVEGTLSQHLRLDIKERRLKVRGEGR